MHSREKIYDADRDGMEMHVVCVARDEKWKSRLIRLAEVEGCHLQKDVMGAIKTSKCWTKEPNVFGELMGDLGVNCRNTGLG